MTGKTHRIIGLVAGLGYFLVSTESIYQPATLGVVVVASYLGSLLPDADDAGADIWSTLPFGHTIGKIGDPVLKHRSISHSLIGLLAYTYLIYLLLLSFPSYWNVDVWSVVIASGVAFASHLLADTFTVQGIPLLWPWKYKLGIPPKPFQGLRIQTGKWFENLVLLPAVNIILIVIVVFYWSKIEKLIYR